jgi:predicted DNA binding CopG/RHH family protein
MIQDQYPEYVLDRVKERANAMGMPCQALIKAAMIKPYVDPESERETV